MSAKTQAYVPALSSTREFEQPAAYVPFKNSTIIYENLTLKLEVPERPLAWGSVKITAKNGASLHTPEAYELLQRIARTWEMRGISDYFVYSNETADKVPTWEIVPFQKSGLRFWKQFKVLWNITFGGSILPLVERRKIAEDFFPSNIHHTVQTVVHKNDAFCTKEVIDRQIVFEGREVNVLYNYAPLDKYHFLIVPKLHRSRFSDLTASECLETAILTKKLIDYFKSESVFLFHKTGQEAGQTEPHWHAHAVFSTSARAFFSKLIILKNMLFGSSRLPDQELAIRVKALHEKLSTVLI